VEAIMQTVTEWTDDLSLPPTLLPGIRRVLTFIEENFADPIPLSDLSSLAGLSLHRFVTVFRSQIGIPPHQYICRTRVRQARAMLRKGLPLAAVALDAGFCDQSHLSRHFKRQCGVTPGSFAGLRSSSRPTGVIPCD
jgi:AraC-like DNA-binding protein